MKMLIKILSLFFLLSSCNKAPETKPQNRLAIDVSELTVSHEQIDKEIKLESESDWAAYAEDKSWIKISPSSGMSGAYDVKIQISANKGASERSSNIVFMYGTERKSVPVVQAGNPDVADEPEEGDDGGDGNAPAVPDGAFVPEGYRLFWSDEFEGTSLNSANWTCEIGRGSNGWGNSELQYYTDRPENIAVRDGKLVITARKESYQGAEATSARLITLGKVFFKYGYITASIKLPKTADGLWPAFWMMGNDFRSKGWPNCGETDILEMGHANGIKKGTQEKFLNGACHWGQPGHAYYSYDFTNSDSVQDGKFHTFTCIWTERQIAMYIDLDTNPDAKPYFKMDLKDFGDDEFRKDNFILFNLAVGGNFPAIWDIGQITALDNGPAEMEIDYVRVFQKP